MYRLFLVFHILILSREVHSAEDCSTEDCSQEDTDLSSLVQVAKLSAGKNLRQGSGEVSDFGEYPWSQRGRDYTQGSRSPHSAPTNFSAGETWKWLNEHDEQVRHSPLIDNHKNIYVTTGWKIRKFDAHGNILWTLDTEKQVSAPALYRGRIYAVEKIEGGVNLLAIDKEDSSVILNKSIARQQDGDASSVFVYDDTVIFPMQSATMKNIHNVYAANASDGSFLWEYEPDDSLWNFSPSSPGDGTIVFAGSCGGAYRLSLKGELVWKVDRSSPTEVLSDGSIDYFCGTGGGSMGPNNVFYHEHNDHQQGKSYVVARRLRDGHLLWRKDVTGWLPTSKGNPYIANQYPAVGEVMVGGTKRLAVVAGLGQTVGSLIPMDTSDERWVNFVVAMDADTGDVLWQYEEAKWPGQFSEGDGAEAIAKRESKVALGKAKTDTICLPDPQGIPLISGDGTVYMSSSHWGALRSMSDKDGNGIIDDSEVSSFRTHNCFLNSPSIADGMLVAAPCWGPMYVFKSSPLAYFGTA
jgi:outer membrane protein assembly factor BamB